MTWCSGSYSSFLKEGMWRYSRKCVARENYAALEIGIVARISVVKAVSFKASRNHQLKYEVGSMDICKVDFIGWHVYMCENIFSLVWQIFLFWMPSQNRGLGFSTVSHSRSFLHFKSISPFRWMGLRCPVTSCTKCILWRINHLIVVEFRISRANSISCAADYDH